MSNNPGLGNDVVKEAYAVVVGIGSYRHDRISRLAYTRADAEAFCQLLQDPRHANLQAEHIRLLLDQEATLANLKSALGGWLRLQASPDSTVFLFFAGHGGQEADVAGLNPDQRASYLLPWDTDPDDFFTTALANDEFNKYLRAVRARRTVVFLDACHSGGVIRQGARDVGTLCLPTFEQLAEGEGRVVVAAAKPDQRSWEDGSLGHGIFTHHLLEALSGKADLNGDGYVSIRETIEYLQRQIPQTARRLGKEPQDPYLVSEGTGDIILAVDRERIACRLKELDEQERQRLARLKEERAQLQKLRDDGLLAGADYVEAIGLLERPAEKLTAAEKLLRENLGTLLRGGMSVEVYLANRRFIIGQSDSIHRPPKRPEPVPQRFCTQCGARVQPGNQFCTGCGRRL